MNNRSFWFGYKISLVKRIALAGILMAIGVILNKVVQIGYPYIPVPFVRISFGGPALIIISALLLGPIYGGFIGFMVDLLGYFIFDIKTFGYYPLISTTYLLLGFIAGLLFGFISKIRNKKINQIIIYSISGVLFIGLTILLIFSDKVDFLSSSYQIQDWMKIVFPILMALFFVGLVIFLTIYDKKTKDKNNTFIDVYQLGLVCFILDLFIMTIYGSLMKGLSFGMDLFGIILITQAMTMFFNIPFNVVLITTLSQALKRYMI